MTITPPNPIIQGHVSWTRTARGERAIVALTTSRDLDLRTELIAGFRAKISEADSMSDDEVVDHYVRFLLSCPIKCPHCHPEAMS